MSCWWSWNRIDSGYDYEDANWPIYIELNNNEDGRGSHAKVKGGGVGG